MTAVLEDEDVTAYPQLVRQMEDAQRSYVSALLGLRDIYDDISDDVGYFGFAREYMPFPALDAQSANAFVVAIDSARNKVETAKEKENAALASSRAFDVDQVAFDAELHQIAENYESRLGSICGTFVGDADRVYPAIPKYAPMHDTLRLFQDPCGLVGNGELHDAMTGMEIAGVDLDSAVARLDGIIKQIGVEQKTAERECQQHMAMAKYVFEEQGNVETLQDQLEAAQKDAEELNRAYGYLQQLAGQLHCGGLDCGGSLAAMAAMTAVYLSTDGEFVANADKQSSLRDQIRSKEQALGKWQTEQQCEFAEIQSDAAVKKLVISLVTARLDILRARYVSLSAASSIVKLRNEATRLMAAQQDAEQLAINSQTAKNDPNVRIYKNDAIITADRTFYAAVREAYRATLVYEYYTSQTYARKSDLFLVRMIQSGDISLERYLADLEEAFYAFEEQYGRPELRVAIMSLRDDVFQIPQLGQDGRALSIAERVTQFRQRLTDARLLDLKGYRSVPFSMTLGYLSPATRNHKINYVETELIGSNVGDTLGRVYLRQAGTGVVRNLEANYSYYLFPERLAVVNPFFNGTKPLDPQVYRNHSLTDRPLVNTRWEIVLNQKDERVNQDVDLNSLTDIRLYFYYTDFTRM